MTTIEIEREKLYSYYNWAWILGLVTIPLWFLFFKAIRRSTDYYTVSYNEGNIYTKRRFDWCGFVLYNVENAVPFARITNVSLVQGIVSEKLGIWFLKIQTAGNSGPSSPELVIQAPVNPEELRDKLLELSRLASSNAATNEVGT